MAIKVNQNNMNNKFKVIIKRGPEFDGISIWLTIDHGNGHYSLAKPIDDFIFEEYKESGEPVKPTLKLNSFFAQEFLQAWAEALKEEKISVEDTFKLEGQIEATKYHLEDMRRLVFEKSTTITIDPNNLSCAHGSCLPGKCNYKDEIKK